MTVIAENTKTCSVCGKKVLHYHAQMACDVKCIYVNDLGHSCQDCENEYEGAIICCDCEDKNYQEYIAKGKNEK